MASQLVREQATVAHSMHSAGHLAFSLITAARELIRRRSIGEPEEQAQ